MTDKRPCVYILASRRNGTLYVGVTSDLARRVAEHRADAVAGFTRRYGVHTLVFVEFHATIANAILREKRIKRWRRAWKLEAIERQNPGWRDLPHNLGATIWRRSLQTGSPLSRGRQYVHPTIRDPPARMERGK